LANLRYGQKFVEIVLSVLRKKLFLKKLVLKFWSEVC
jgi:hypothetical protein